MTADFAQLLPNLGVAGFALFILWKMYDSSQKRMKEKDSELITEIDKRDQRLEEHEKSFREYALKIHDSSTLQISENTKALQQSAKIMQDITVHLSNARPQPVIIQNNTSENK